MPIGLLFFFFLIKMPECHILLYSRLWRGSSQTWDFCLRTAKLFSNPLCMPVEWLWCLALKISPSDGAFLVIRMEDGKSFNRMCDFFLEKAKIKEEKAKINITVKRNRWVRNPFLQTLFVFEEVGWGCPTFHHGCHVPNLKIVTSRQASVTG